MNNGVPYKTLTITPEEAAMIEHAVENERREIDYALRSGYYTHLPKTKERQINMINTATTILKKLGDK